MEKQVTVLYYDEHEMIQLKSEQLVCNTGNTGRVLLPADFRKGKTIIALIEGHVNVLNTLGDRYNSDEQVDMAKTA